MELRKFATWEYLIIGGLALWVITWLVAFVAVFVRLVAGIMVLVGFVDLILFLIRRRKRISPPQKEGMDK